MFSTKETDTFSRKSFFDVVVRTALSEIGDKGGKEIIKNFAFKARDRYYLVTKYLYEHGLLEDRTILDLGPFPGSFLKILRQLPWSKNLILFGAGLNVSAEFIKSMQKEAQATMMEVNLDPHNPDLKERNINTQIHIKDNSVHWVHAGEVVEHLTNPGWMLAESFRVLKTGGFLLITTPNVTRIGNIYKLMVGRTNYDRLVMIGNQKPEDEWRGHFREYDMNELSTMMELNGFEVIKKQYYNNDSETDVSFKECLKKPFCLVPHFRGDLFLAARKN